MMEERGNPAGYQANGRPFGVTFAGKAFSEAALIRIAYAFEQHTKHRKKPVLGQTLTDHSAVISMKTTVFLNGRTPQTLIDIDVYVPGLFCVVSGSPVRCL